MLGLAIGVGVLIGVSLGALGGGGSILTVPALVYLLHQDTHAATTGSLIIVGITALAGAVVHGRRGRVRFLAGTAFGLLGVAGSYFGSRASTAVAQHVLLSAFAGLMLVAALAMVRRERGGAELERENGPAGEAGDEPATPGGGTATLSRPASAVSTNALLDAATVAKIVVTATVVGLLTGFFGVGGGFVVVPALVLALGFDMTVAVGTSLLVIAINSAAALGVRAASGVGVHLDWLLLTTFTVAAIGGTAAGGRLASRVAPRTLVRSFAALLVVLAGYLAAMNLPHLL